MKKKISYIFLNYLRILAKIQLFKIRTLARIKYNRFHIIGITGSAGKTSTLLALEAILKPQFKVKTNSGSNSESGIPLNILGLKANDFTFSSWLKLAILAPIKLLTNWKIYEIYIVEMGIDEPEAPKNMSYLLKILKPDIGIFLNVNLVHSAQFDHTVDPKIDSQKRIEAILNNIGLEKAKLINSLPQTGTAIINLDDPVVQKTCKLTPAKILSFSQTTGATLKILKTEVGHNGFHLSFAYDHKHYSINLPDYVLPQIYSHSIVASILTGLSLGISIDQIVINLEKHLTLAPGRSSLISGIKDTKIIDSTYNSSPLACIEMLKLLDNFKSKKIAVLGDMRELGQQSKAAHKQVEKQALKTADLIITVGLETKKYFAKNIKVYSFIYWWQAAKFLETQIKGHETILVKGSQNTIYLEELVKTILKNPSDSSLLCRQSPYWLKTKSQFRASVN